MILPALGLLVLALAALAVRIHRYGRVPHHGPPHPIPAVVLGARVRPDGTPTPALVGRVEQGVTLLRGGAATELTFSGGSPDHRPTEAAVMLELARGLGVDPASCRLETTSRSTWDNARHCAAIRTERQILLVTCDFHLYRATAHFRAQGFEVFPIASHRTLRPAQRLRVALQELFAVLRRPWLLH